tara:strand:- start:183 stop:488 length:306 start_codon:yes stop_codon:yes gene_type:complete
MKLFLLLLNIYFVVGNNEIIERFEYEQCFTLPPKTVNNLNDIVPYNCPNGYLKYQNYFEYQFLDPENCIIKNGCNINQNLTNHKERNLVKIHSICCKKKLI